MPSTNKRSAADRSRVPELLTFFCDVLADRLRRHGASRNESNEIALDVTDVMRSEFGGQAIYFPKGAVADAHEKANEIYQGFMQGKTIPELAREFDCSTVWVYRRISHVRAMLKEARGNK